MANRPVASPSTHEGGAEGRPLPDVAGREAWRAIVARFQRPSALRASWQLVNTIGGYVLLWGLIYWSLSISWWLTIPLAILAGGFLVRVFIIFHDCGHGSFFASKSANAFWGFVTGLLTMTPYYHWRGGHAVHHGTTGDLDRRGIGDIWTMTVQEYLESTRWKRFAYRIARNPFVLFVIAPLVMMVVLQRFPAKGADRRQRNSVWIMNGAVAAMAAGMIAIFGLVPYLVVQLTILLVAGSVGIWLFYLQHQFEDVYWERGENWDYATAALKGSSYFRLPRVLQWFSGNIGFHHIHHLSPRIPNYYLDACHRSDPLFQDVVPMGLWQSLRSLGLRLWDESSKKLVGWRHMRQLKRARTQTKAGAGEPRQQGDDEHPQTQ
jgi:omega-6 fatty acid desaturase (delta-12 desaturase)